VEYFRHTDDLDQKEVNKKLLGNRLKKVRKLRGISQKELASKINRSKGFIGQIEVGMCTMSFFLIMEVCRVLNVPLDYFDIRKPLKQQKEVIIERNK